MFPVGMLAFSAVCDGAHVVQPRARWWGRAAQAAIGAGLVGVAIAAPFGLVDYLAIPPGTRAKRIGRLHGLGNLGVGGLFLASWLLRRSKHVRSGVALSTMGMLSAGFTLWLGTELVNRLGVGVYEPTSFDAPSSRHRRSSVAASGDGPSL